MKKYTRIFYNILYSGISLGLVTALFLPQASSATTIDDAHISNVTATSDVSTLGTAASYTIEFVTTADMANGEHLNIDFISTAGCRDENWEDCYVDLRDATVSGLAVESSLSQTTATITLQENLAAGTHTVVLANVVNPPSANAVRVHINASSSDEEAILGENYDSEVWYSTAANTAMQFGTVLVEGFIMTPSEEVISGVSIDIYNEDWSAWASAGSDDFGYYAIFSDYEAAGYWANGEYTLTSYPGDQNANFVNTNQTLTYSGSPLNQDITLTEAAYFFAGQVTYGENTSTTVSANPGDVVDDAYVSFTAEDGSGSYGSAVDADGNYSMPVLAGNYRVSISRNGEALVDWYYDDWETIYSILEEGTATVNFEVSPTNAIASGVLIPTEEVDLSGWINFSNESYNFGTSTNAAGEYELNLNSGTYTVTWEPNADNSAAQQYSYTGTYTISEGNNSYDVTLNALTSSVNFTVVDADNNPVADVTAQVWGENFYRGKSTDSNGQVTIYVPSDASLEASVWSEQYLYTGGSESISLATDESVDLSYTVQIPNANIDVTLALEDGSVPDSLYGYVWCSTDDYSQYFGSDFYNGTTTIELIVGDTEDFSGVCNAWISGDEYSVDAEQEVSVAQDATAQVAFTLLERDATVNVNVKNFATGQLISPSSDVNVYLWNKDNTWADGTLTDNPLAVSVVSGKKWYGGVWSHTSQYLPLWSLNDTAVEPDSGETASLILNVLEQDGTLPITVSGPNGETVSYGWAWCGNWNDPFIDSENAIVDSGAEIIDGVAQIPLVSGYTYTCGVGLPSEFVTLGWMSPAEQEVKYASADQSLDTLTFQFEEADATLVGTVNVESAGVQASDIESDIEQVWCWAWSEDGGHSFTEVEPGDSYQLNVQSGRTWYAGCDAQSEDTWYWSDQYQFTAKKSDNQHDFVLSESPWVIYDGISETFEASENKVITTPDGTSVTIPASTLTTSGSVTVTATPVDQIVRTDDNPLVVPWNWEATNADGQLIETFNGQVTMTIPYDASVIDEVGASEDVIAGKYYDEVSGEWKLPDNMTIDKDTNTITILTDHFSQYGVLYNARLTSTAKPKAPKNIRIERRTEHSLRYVVSLKSSSDRPTKLKHQLRWRKNGTSGKWTAWKGKKTKRISTDSEKTKWTLQRAGLKSATKYQIRARFCNSAGCSKWVQNSAMTK